MGLPLLALPLVGLAALLRAARLGLVERVGALLEHLKVGADGAGAGAALAALGLLSLLLVEKVRLFGVGIGTRATNQTANGGTEHPDREAGNGRVGKGGRGELVGLSL